MSEIRFQNEENGFTVLSLVAGGREETVVGVLPYLNEGERVLVRGEWTEHPSFGRQLNAQEYEVILPTRADEIERFLGCGLIKGVGPSMAHAIVHRFGEETLRVISESPEKLVSVPGIGPKRAAAIGKAYADKFETREALLFLSKYQLSLALSMRILNAYGKAAVAILKQNPYRLSYDVQGIGFRTADRIAFSMGFARNDPNRVRAGLVYTLREAAASVGHVYLPKEELLQSASGILQVAREEVENEYAALRLTRQVVEEETEDGQAVYEAQMYDAELECARLLCGLLEAPADALGLDAAQAIEDFERQRDIAFEQEQRKAITLALREGVCVITGGPGTGKTTVLNCVLELLGRAGLAVSLAAPTGRAAKRMTEATGQEAQTIHRLLGYGGEGERGLHFTRDQRDPIQADVVVLDEMSMVDLLLFRAFLRAVKRGTRLILVGDSDQLPSVGAGNVLLDILRSGRVPTVRLTQVFRQAAMSQIVLNAHRINEGKMPVLSNKNTDFFFERRDSLSRIADSVTSLCLDRLPGYFHIDPMQDIQVLSPVKKGEAGVVALNQRLQQALNPPSRRKNERRFGETLFREGDKVMQTRNDYQAEWTRQTDAGLEDGLGVFNGDMGRVLSIDEGEVEVLFDDDRRVVYSDAMLADLDLAYAITIHKSQGSEFDTVVLALSPGHPRMMARNLLYTAVTRAKSRVVLVGAEALVQRMVLNDHTVRRYSLLSRRLREE